MCSCLNIAQPVISRSSFQREISVTGQEREKKIAKPKLLSSQARKTNAFLKEHNNGLAQCNTIQYSTIQCNTKQMQHKAMQRNGMQCYTEKQFYLYIVGFMA